MSAKKRVAILISGRGSNMSALIEATKAADYPARIIGVISNNASAPGLKIAKEHHLPTAVHQLASYTDKNATDNAITKTLEEWKTDIVCLAGFMRILSDDFATRWHNRLINIHPSLLPEYKGLNTHARALEAGDKTHGCTVHHVVAELDAGPIILQHNVPILPGDTIQTLEKRVLAAEHILYPRALHSLIDMME
ncbi:MAG: phosphoribosylglycinamide formyltransferase [Devosiaceae bacterium]|nr:phosphoribosylglycinamide formyltransferase [Devosiaceae bacterium]